MSSRLKALRDSLNGEEKDFTTGSPRGAIALLAIPMILETAMESVFSVVDIFFVARLGDDAVATVGLTERLSTFVFSIAMGLSFATTAFVARRIGEKDPAAARGAVQSIFIGLVGMFFATTRGRVSDFTPTMMLIIGMGRCLNLTMQPEMLFLFSCTSIHAPTTAVIPITGSRAGTCQSRILILTLPLKLAQ